MFNTAYIKITPTDEEGHKGSSVVISFGLANTTPEVEIVPLSGTYSGTIVVAYRLLCDEASDKVAVTVEFSTDGVNFSPATEEDSVYSDGVTSLPTSPSGLTHLFFWETLTDIGATIESLVYLRISPSDSQGTGVEKVTGPFTVDNNLLPYAEVVMPSGVQSGLVTISYILHDKNSNPTEITVEYSLDGGLTYSPATISATDEGTISGNQITGLSSGSGGVLHSFTWDSSIDADKIYTPQCRIRLLPYNGTYYGPYEATGDFVLSNNGVPACFLSAVGAIKTGNIQFWFTLSDAESDRCSIEVFYSSDDGVSFFPATLSSGATIDLPSDGSWLSVTWNSSVDLPDTFVDKVRLKIVPYDFPGRAGTADVTNAFVVDNTVWAGEERVTINSSSDSEKPAIAVTSDNTPVLLFEDTREGDKNIYWAKKVSGNWYSNKFIGASGVADTDPDCVVNSQDWLCGVWVADGKYLGYWMVRVSDGYWSIVNLKWLQASNTSAVAEPSVAIDESDNIYVVWADEISGKYEIYLRVRNSAGVWTPAINSSPIQVSNSGSEARNPRVVFSNGLLHIVWRDKKDGDFEIYYNTYDPSTGLCGTPLKLTDNTSDDLAPDIMAGSGKLFVSYTRKSGDFDVYRRIFDGSSWGAEGVVYNTTKDCKSPRLAMRLSALNVVWYENDGSRDQIYHTYGIGGSSFISPTNVSSIASGDARFPDIVSDTKGRLHICYQSNKNGRGEIFYRKR
ncbi:MAG: hypothetical protein N2234_08875 [Planctomycetota bacterium]|nr:hypothetical protein [Planctomycetota bacterium]